MTERSNGAVAPNPGLVRSLKPRILALLADEWDTTGPPVFMDTDELARRLDAPRGATRTAVEALHFEGLVETNQGTQSVSLTDRGYEAARRAIGESPRVNQLIFKGPVHGSAIAVGGSAATVSATVNVLEQLANAIEKDTTIPAEKRWKWREALLEMSKNPMLLEVVRRIFSGGI